VAKQDIQEVESAKRAGAPYSHHRNQAKGTIMKLRQQLANAPCVNKKLTRTYFTFCFGGLK
jgi:hypothetical protein